MLLAKFALSIVLLVCVSTSELFRDVSFDAALSAARSEKKIVMIDFFTTWCGPCKKLDATTWKDAKVLEWAGKNCVALRFDAEKETELAKRFQVGAYPTILLLKSDGTEIDRIVGYKDADTFLSNVADALAGRNGVTRAKAKLEGHEKDPMVRQDYGDALAQAGKYDEALQEYLWCFDHGDESMGYGGVRLSFLLGDIKRLGASHPPALKALEDRRDAAQAALLETPDDYKHASEMAAIDRELGTVKRTLAVHDQLEKAGPLPSGFRFGVQRELLPLLVADRRYQSALDLFDDPGSYVDQDIRIRSEMPELEAPDPTMKEAMARVAARMKTETVRECATIHEAFVGVGRLDEAAKTADRLIVYAPAGETYATLVKSAARAGNNDVARSIGERGLKAVPESEQKVVRAALDRVPTPK